MATGQPATVTNLAGALIERIERRGWGERLALTGPAGMLDYATLGRRSRQFATWCRNRGLEAGERILILVHDRPDFVVAYLGAIWAGLVPVGLNLRLSVAELGHIIVDSGARLIVLDREFEDLFSRASSDLATPPVPLVADAPEGGLLSVLQSLLPHPSAHPCRHDDPAIWLYTSGTTGRPKAVVHGHSVLNGVDRHLSAVLPIDEGARVFCTSKLFFAYSLAHGLFSSLYRGATSVLYPGWPDPASIRAIVAEYAPTIVFSVPAMYRGLLGELGSQPPAFAQVGHFVSAGERLPETLYDRWRALTGRPLVEGMGTTESLFLLLANPPGRTRSGSCGRPTPGTVAELRDAAGGGPVEPGMPGVLWVRSDSLALGYHGRPEDTAKVFKDGWYCTGDTFVQDAEGCYYHQARTDDMLKISGQWVSPAEIEEQVLKDAAILEAAVVGVEDQDGLTRLWLFAVSHAGSDQATGLGDSLLARLREELAIYKCPRRMIFLDNLPRTATGKIQRHKLRARARALLSGSSRTPEHGQR